MTAEHRKPNIQTITDDDLLAELTALTTVDDTLDERSAAGLAEMETLVADGVALSIRNHVANDAALADMEALTADGVAFTLRNRVADEAALADMGRLTADGDAFTLRNQAADRDALDAMEALSADGLAFTERNRVADAAALAAFEALSTPTPNKPSSVGGDGALSAPQDGHLDPRALEPSLANVVDAVRPSSRKPRRDHGYDR